MVTIGLIGCGGMGNTHANCYLALGDRVKVIAVADVREDKRLNIANLTGATPYESADELLENEKPDVIDICLPTYLHTKYAVMAMEKGCDLFMEKPAGLNDEDCDRLLEVQKKTGAKVQVGHVVRFMDPYAYIKKLADEGTYGKVLSGTFERLSANPRWSWENWYNIPERSGSGALDLHIHDTDFIRYLMNGEPDNMVSYATRNSDGMISQIDTTFNYGDVHIKAEGCWYDPEKFPFSSKCRVAFERAVAVATISTLKIYTNDGEVIEPVFESVGNAGADSGINITDLGGYYKELEYFIDKVLSGKGPEIASLADAVKSAKLVYREIELAGGVQIK